MRKVGFGVIGCGVISTAYLKAAQRFANLSDLACLACLEQCWAHDAKPMSRNAQNKTTRIILVFSVGRVTTALV